VNLLEFTYIISRKFNIFKYNKFLNINLLFFYKKSERIGFIQSKNKYRTGIFTLFLLFPYLILCYREQGEY